MRGTHVLDSLNVHVMLLFCVRVSCQDKILYGPKWISIEENSTLCDVLRCATGDKYLSRKLKVVVASEKSLRDLSFVKLGLPVVILDKNDKKIVSFLLKPDDAVITVSNLYFKIIVNVNKNFPKTLLDLISNNRIEILLM